MMILVYQSRKGIIEAQAMAYWVWSLWSGQFILIKFLYHPLEEKKTNATSLRHISHKHHSFKCGRLFWTLDIEPSQFSLVEDDTRRASWEQEVLRDYEDAISNVLKKQPKLNWVIGRA